MTQLKRQQSSTLESVPEGRSIVRVDEDDDLHVPRFVHSRVWSWPMLTTKRSSPRRSSRVDNEYPWTWEIPEQSLKPVPSNQILNRLSIEVDLPLTTILARTAAYMRVKSVAGVVHWKEATIDCLTPCLMHFVIQFWRGLGSKIIVELHRLQGCSVTMQCVHIGLFDAIYTGEVPDEHESRNRIFNRRRAPICQQIRTLYERGLQERGLVSTNETISCKEGLVMTEGLLDSPCDDQNRLGLENLMFLSDSMVVSKRTAQQVARAILLEEGPFALTLRYNLKHYLEIQWNDLPDEADDEEGEVLEFSEIHKSVVMHRLALKVLANVLESTKDIEDERMIDTSSITSSNSDWWTTIIDALEYNVREAVRRPQEAALSAKCLLLLKVEFPGLMTTPVEDRLVPALVRANKYGHAHHLLLELETRRLLQSLLS